MFQEFFQHGRRSQGDMAFVLVSAAFEKFVEAEAFLELDRIAHHSMLLFNQMFT